MEGGEIAGIVIGSVLLLLIILVFVMYYKYKSWVRSPSDDKSTYKLDAFFCVINKKTNTSHKLSRNGLPNDHVRPSVKYESRNGSVNVSFEYGPGDQKRSVSDSNQSTDSETTRVEDKTMTCLGGETTRVEDKTMTCLVVPESPIRQSAETYSYIDLNE